MIQPRRITAALKNLAWKRRHETLKVNWAKFTKETLKVI